MTDVRLVNGDCVEAMAAMPEASVDAIVCDPPYGLEFMGREWDKLGADGVGQSKEKPITDGDFKGLRIEGYHGDANVKCRICSRWKWDHAGRKCDCAAPDFPNAKAHQARAMQEWHYRWAVEALRVLKPGGYLLAFGGTRTYHRLACAVEDAGFEIRDRVLVLNAEGEQVEVEHPTELAWLYGSGFPKSLDVSKAIDKAARGVPQGGADPTSVNHGRYKTQATEGKRGEGDAGQGYGAGPGQFMAEPGVADDPEITDPEALRWQGWGTALKPATEPIVVARKPLIGTVARNVQEWGTGALNIDGCRIGYESQRDQDAAKPGGRATGKSGALAGGSQNDADRREFEADNSKGRWPANVCLVHHDDCVLVGERRVRSGTAVRENVGKPGSGNIDFAPGNPDMRENAGFADEDGRETVEAWECVEGCPVQALDEQSGDLSRGKPNAGVGKAYAGLTGGGAFRQAAPSWHDFGDSGGASRFFYVAKASRAERNAGLEDFAETVEARTPMAGRGQGGLKCKACGRWKVSGNPCVCAEPEFEPSEFVRPPSANRHPTVKPIALMRWLVRLVTPPGGTVLDPFMGSGTTGIAAVLEGFEFVGIEKYPRDGEPEDPDYFGIAEARIAFWQEHGEDGLRIVRERETAERKSETRREEHAAAGQDVLF